MLTVLLGKTRAGEFQRTKIGLTAALLALDNNFLVFSHWDVRLLALAVAVPPQLLSFHTSPGRAG